jgi:hypothetical protein
VISALVIRLVMVPGPPGHPDNCEAMATYVGEDGKPLDEPRPDPAHIVPILLQAALGHAAQVDIWQGQRPIVRVVQQPGNGRIDRNLRGM